MARRLGDQLKAKSVEKEAPSGPIDSAFTKAIDQKIAEVDDAMRREEARDMILDGRGDALTGDGKVDTIVVGGEAVDVVSERQNFDDYREVMPAPSHPAVARQPEVVDYRRLALRCLAASTGHGLSADRELLEAAAVALAELGGFSL